MTFYHHISDRGLQRSVVEDGNKCFSAVMNILENHLGNLGK